VGVKECGNCYFAQYEPLGNAKWNNLGLARIAANPYVGGNLILFLVAPAVLVFFILFYPVLSCPPLHPRYILTKVKQISPHS